MEWTFDFRSPLLQIFAFFLKTSLLPCLLLAILLFPTFILFTSLRYSFSLIMSSFLFDYATGMGGSDSEGSIEQPLMDREVISIGSSSSLDARRGAVDSKSSSLEKVKASCHTSGGSSHLRGRVRPSVASGEPFLVTMILPPVAFGGVRRGSGNGDARAFAHVRCSHSAGSPSSPLAIVGCRNLPFSGGMKRLLGWAKGASSKERKRMESPPMFI